MLGTSQSLIDRDLIYITSPTKKAGLYVANKVILKVFYVGWPVTTLRLTHPFFWLWSKERGWRPSCKHVGGTAVEFKVCSRFQCTCIDIYPDSSWAVGSRYTTGRAVCLARYGHKKGRPGGLDACLRKEKFAYRRKNEPGRLLRLNSYRSCRVKPLDGSPAGLNHPVGLHWWSAVAIIVSRSTIIRLES